MQVVKCDRCERECTNSYMKFKLPIHIFEGDMKGYAILEHGGLVSVSGRDMEYELCHTCYNKAYKAAFAVIQEKDDDNSND
jgi:hypothetical protein